VKVVLQRVHRAEVQVGGQQVGACGRGVLLLVGIGPQDLDKDAQWMARKIAGLRIFPDSDGRMNLSLLDIQGGALSISQFTLYGDCRKGRRPSFLGAAKPELAEPLWEKFCDLLMAEGVPTARGRFGADMQISANADGPVTLVLESPCSSEPSKQP
jgi:D-tyrosyl-tRNA(Tyr) deacylase